MKVREIVGKMSMILFYILSGIAIIMIIIKLTGHSPTMDQIMLMIMSAMFIVVIKNQQDLGKLKGEFKHLNKKVDIIGNDLKLYLAKH